MDQWDFYSRTWFVSQKCLLPQGWITTVLRIRNKKNYRNQKKDLLIVHSIFQSQQTAADIHVRTEKVSEPVAQSLGVQMRHSAGINWERCAVQSWGRSWHLLPTQHPAVPTLVHLSLSISSWGSAGRSVELRLFLLHLSAMFSMLNSM